MGTAPGASASPPRGRVAVWVWVVIGAASLVPIVLLAPIIAPVALVVVITGIVGWSRGTRTWLRFRSKKAAIGVTAAAAAVLLLTGSVTASIRPPEEGTEASSSSSSEHAVVETTPTSTPRPTRSASPTPTPTPIVREEVVTEAVAFEVTTMEDASIASGETRVTTVGQPGERTLTYRITELDGAEVSRELVSDVVTVEPVAEVTAIGTYVAPPPEPEPAPVDPGGGCDPNYAEACVPIASDVDCAGGSGDGPEYFDGIARVIGVDIYDLDRDGDGYACE
ncbi:G5 domain-containing protein [Microbacterium betulae]|uniref:G5 domain-containing protein n=1 Tax=Microbacterium betulae TaxID=2981139 RepID=A0AA97FIH4_9MICO|nr:G5 domain-containing protein [Microbacterium sp. AB]WOF23224.1 G5 domain-containing protein [Microbacterium sp. AB]